MKKIVCPVDFSPASLNALEYAFEISHKFNTELVLLHSNHPKPQEALSMEDIFEKEEQIKERLEEICEAHAHKNHYQEINYWFIVKTGLAADSILTLIKENEFDMVIIGTKGKEGMGTILGTLSAEIAEKATCPVIIIPEDYPYKEIKNIVFATDLRENENSLFTYVIDFSQTFQAHISILNIQKKGSKDIKENISHGENLLHLYQYPYMSFHVVEKENIIDGINSFAENNKADLIVMATYDRSLLQKIISKSHTRQMAYHTNIPLLVMHKEKVYQNN